MPKPKPLRPEEVPEELRCFVDFEGQYVTVLAGKRQSVIRVTCPDCGENRWLRTHSIRPAVKRGYWTAVCRACGGAHRSNPPRGCANSKWKGGRYVAKGGYVDRALSGFTEREQLILRVMVRPRKGTVAEHRAVVALALGRALKDSELVHHINGDRSDNRLENLELVDHHGRRICPNCGWPMNEFMVAGNGVGDHEDL